MSYLESPERSYEVETDFRSEVRILAGSKSCGAERTSSKRESAVRASPVDSETIAVTISGVHWGNRRAVSTSRTVSPEDWEPDALLEGGKGELVRSKTSRSADGIGWVSDATR